MNFEWMWVFGIPFLPFSPLKIGTLIFLLYIFSFDLHGGEGGNFSEKDRDHYEEEKKLGFLFKNLSEIY